MKKNLLTFLFVVAFLCCGTLVASAKTSLSSMNSAELSKAARTISNNIEALAAKCQVGMDCEGELHALREANKRYLLECSPPYDASCAPRWARQLIVAGEQYDECVGGATSKNLFITKDRIRRGQGAVG